MPNGETTWEWTPGAPHNWHLARGGPGRGLLSLEETFLPHGRERQREGQGRLEEAAPGFIIER